MTVSNLADFKQQSVTSGLSDALYLEAFRAIAVQQSLLRWNRKKTSFLEDIVRAINFVEIDDFWRIKTFWTSRMDLACFSRICGAVAAKIQRLCRWYDRRCREMAVFSTYLFFLQI